MQVDLSYWQQAWNKALPDLNSFKFMPSNGFSLSSIPLRVSQLDAEILDEEVVKLLQTPFSNALSLLNSHWTSKFDSEIDLITRMALYKFSLWDVGATYGAKLQGLKYSVLNTLKVPRKILILHANLTIVTPYIISRLRKHALSNSWPDRPSSDRRRRIWELMSWLENAYVTLSLLNFSLFLWNGRYRTLADRLLYMQLVSTRQTVNREVSYEFMNRQMVWHAFTEFLLFVLPLFNGRSLHRTFQILNNSLRTLLSPTINSYIGNDKNNNLVQEKGRYSPLPLDQCGICAEKATYSTSTLLSSNTTNYGRVSFPIVTPYETSCGHIYCYYCISEQLVRAADDGVDRWQCLRCGQLVNKCRRVTARLDDGTKSSGSWESDDEGVLSSYGDNKSDLSIAKDAEAY